MSGRGLFSETKKLFARNRHMDVVRRAAKFRADSHPSFLVSSLEALRPPLLRVVQKTGHCTISPLKRDPCRTWDQYYRAYTIEHYQLLMFMSGPQALSSLP